MVDHDRIHGPLALGQLQADLPHRVDDPNRGIRVWIVIAGSILEVIRTRQSSLVLNWTAQKTTQARGQFRHRNIRAGDAASSNDGPSTGLACPMKPLRVLGWLQFERLVPPRQDVDEAIPFLDNSDTWFHWLLISSGLVAVGVLFEGPETLMSRRRRVAMAAGPAASPTVRRKGRS
jgi:hypothetical protein